MAVKSGSDFESHYNGSTGSDGETREGNYHGYSDGESVRINNAKDGHGSFMAKGGTSTHKQERITFISLITLLLDKIITKKVMKLVNV
jgi:hypothetical protein